MKAEEILVRLAGVRPSGVGWMACCPAHEDRNPSLSIREANGKLLLHCFANCTTEAICAALKIEMRELFAEACALRQTEPRILRDAERQIASLRGRLTPRDREREIALVFATRENLDAAIARGLALAVEGELVQVASGEVAQ
jgi:hypothetical protein